LQTLNHPQLIDLLQRAYSAEKAASFAYQGHAGSVKSSEEKQAIRQIELDEWNHRSEVLKIMQQYHIPVSKFYEVKYHIIGKPFRSVVISSVGLCLFILPEVWKAVMCASISE